MPRKPRYWGTWKGYVIKAITVDNARTRQDLYDQTGLSEQSLNTALSELYDIGILTKINGMYRISYDVYREYKDYVSSTPQESMITQDAVPLEIGLICPYCEKRNNFTIQKNESVEYQCENQYCQKEGHKGYFKSDVFTILQNRRRGLGRRRPTIYYIRPSGQDRLISFESITKNLIMKKGDLIALNYCRSSQGILWKYYTDEWESHSRIFQNITLQHFWKLS